MGGAPLWLTEELHSKDDHTGDSKNNVPYMTANI
jgi:hypothetical protein